MFVQTMVVIHTTVNQLLANVHFLPEAIMNMSCWDDGSGGVYMCTRYHDHMYHYQLVMAYFNIYCLRLFVAYEHVMLG